MGGNSVKRTRRKGTRKIAIFPMTGQLLERCIYALSSIKKRSIFELEKRHKHAEIDHDPDL